MQLTLEKEPQSPFDRVVNLTTQQRALLASHRRHPEHGHQNAVLLILFGGPVDFKRLACAFDSVVRHTDILRIQLPKASVDQAVVKDEIPLSTKIVVQSLAEFNAWAEARAHQALDLERTCYESVIADHGDGTGSWYLNLHHIINDGTSAALVLKSTERVYLGHEIKKQCYFETCFENDVQTTAGSYWRSRSAAPQLDRLYAELTRDTASATQVPVEINKQVASLWDESLSGDYRLITPGLTHAGFVTFMTALYLHRLSGEEHFSIGLVVNHREKSGTQDLIGPGFEIFPVDIRIRQNDTYMDFFRHVSASLLQTLKYALPGISPSADYDAVVNILPASVTRSDFASQPCRVSWLHSGAIDGTHALRVMSSPYKAVAEAPGSDSSLPRLLLDFKNAALGEVDGSVAMVHFRNLLVDCLKNPRNRIGAISLCTNEENKHIVLFGQGPEIDQGFLLNKELEKSLKDNQRIVLHQGVEELSGNELWYWASAVANEIGLNPEAKNTRQRIGIGIKPSIQAVVAIYGAILAGCSFVPLDLDEPEHRVQNLSSRARLTRMFATPQEVDLLRPGSAIQGECYWPEPSPDTEAYLLFTSGSTGEPKGVSITRVGLSAYIHHAVLNYFKGLEQPTAPLFGSLKFDLTLTTLFAPILANGTLHAYPVTAGQALADIAENPQLNWLKATPSQLEVLLQSLPRASNFKTMIVGGEAFSSRLAAELSSRIPGLHQLNEYGPTEAVVGCVLHKVTFKDMSSRTQIPIGRPIRGATLRVMDTHGQPVPPGAAGELWISHEGITKRYLDSPDPFAPFSIYEGRRYYRSGDLVRLVEGNLLAYIGRLDAQIKVDGIRLDPLGVEDVITSHSGIAQSVVRLWSPRHTDSVERCVCCGLPNIVPGALLDEGGICRICHAFDAVKDIASGWFGAAENLLEKLSSARVRATGEYDCMHLLSGGKDSTYALYKLVEMGANPYVLTLDNGYISQSAKDNIQRAVKDLGLVHEYAAPAMMKEILRDSLQRHSNVCNGCYKAIYTMATARADALGINMIITALTRGQLFETRLLPQQFEKHNFDPSEIDSVVLEARKVYHRTRDACYDLPEASVFDREEIFERIEYVDFFRYFDVDLASVLQFLENETCWKRPLDTGRSTNCLINEVGIFTHLKEQGYHNYAIPYAWDVRLGHKTRSEAIAELEDELDIQKIDWQLDEIGYSPSRRKLLAAWYVPHGQGPTTSELHTYLSHRLPAYELPKSFTKVSEIPLTANGKIYDAALPAPERHYNPRAEFSVLAENEVERTIISIWEKELKLEPIGRNDDFFALGGDSLTAIRMILTLGDNLKTKISAEFAFTHPTPSQLALALQPLLKTKESDAYAGATPPTSRTYTKHSPPPLSHGEQAILFEQQNSPEKLKYNAARLFWAEGLVSAERFRTAAIEASTRHIPLSWSYATTRNRQRKDRLVKFTVNDLSLSEKEIRREFRKIIDAPFNLEKGPLFRLAIHYCDDGRTAILFTVHHVACDHESFNILWRQIARIYETGEMPDVCHDYPSYVSKISAQDEENNREFWLTRKIEDPVPLRSLPSHSTFSDGFVSVPLSLKPEDLRRGHRSPLAARSLAAAAMGLKPYLEEGAIDIALLTTARADPQAGDLFGYLLNPVPLQLHCKPEQTIHSLINEAQRQVVEILPHSNYPFSLIHNERYKAKLPAPVIRFLLSFIDQADLELSGMKVVQESAPNRNAVFDATFFVQTYNDHNIKASLEYRSSTFSDEVANCLLKNFRNALDMVHSDPDLKISDYLAGTQSPGVISGAALKKHIPVYERIMVQMDNCQTKLATRCGEEKLTWAELGQRSAVIARQLADKSVGTGCIVAIALPRGSNFISSILAIHSLGAGYVAVDLSNPASRIKSALDIAKPAIVIHGGGFDSSYNDLVVSAEGAGTAIWDEAKEELNRSAPALDGVAYIIFTSGSTGSPKGVPITHGQLSASINAREQVYNDEPENFALLSRFSFDSSIVGIFWTMACGGTIIMPREKDAHDTDALVRMISENKASHMLCTPTLYDMLLDRLAVYGGPTWPTHVILAGETLPPVLVKRHFNRFPDGISLTNEYGPTETSVWATCYHVASADLEEVPIGHPIPGVGIAIVDSLNRLCPVGVPGELVISGSNVASGYIDIADQTAKRFTDGTAFGWDPGPVFRTGDKAIVRDGNIYFLGRLDEQLNVGGMRIEPGEIEDALRFQPGVTDAVVFGHDPRSLETLLSKVSPDFLRKAMAESAKSATPDTDLMDRLRKHIPETQIIIAHIKTTIDAELSTIREGVTRILPTGLLPTRYQLHNSFPISATGKIDRLLLKTWIPDKIKPLPMSSTKEISSFTRMSDSTNTAETFNEKLNRLHALFVKALANPNFNVTDSFFLYGGNSLTLLHLLLDIETEFEISLSTATIYEFPSPIDLYRYLFENETDFPPQVPSSPMPQTIGKQKTRNFVIPIQKEGLRPPIIVIHTLGENGAIFQTLAKSLGKDQPILGIGVNAQINMYGNWVTDPHGPTEIEDIVQGYIEEVKILVPDGPIILAGFCLGVQFAYELAQQLKSRGHEPELLMMLNDLHAPELLQKSDTELSHNWKDRFRRIREKKLAVFPRLIKKLPQLLLQSDQEIKRSIEIVQLNRAIRSGKPLTHRLTIRDYIERSFRAAHNYDFKPYSGRVLIIRKQDRMTYPEIAINNGWGDRLAYPEIHEIKKDAFKNLLDMPHSDQIAAIITTALDTVIANERRGEKESRRYLLS